MSKEAIHFMLTESIAVLLSSVMIAGKTNTSGFATVHQV